MLAVRPLRMALLRRVRCCVLPSTSSPLSFCQQRRAYRRTVVVSLPRSIPEKLGTFHEAQDLNRDTEELGQHHKWGHLARRKKDHFPGNVEIKISSGFGNIRFDRDNLREEGIENSSSTRELKGEEDNDVGGFHVENIPSSQTQTNTPELLYFESIDSQFLTFKPFGASHSEKKSTDIKHKSKKSKNSVDPEKKSTEIKHKLKKSKNSVDPPSSSCIQESELNYFDELTFKDSFDKFSVKTANTPQTVHPSQVSINEFHSSQLGEIDRQFLAVDDDTMTSPDIAAGSLMLSPKSSTSSLTPSPKVSGPLISPLESPEELLSSPETSAVPLRSPPQSSTGPFRSSPQTSAGSETSSSVEIKEAFNNDLGFIDDQFFAQASLPSQSIQTDLSNFQQSTISSQSQSLASSSSSSSSDSGSLLDRGLTTTSEHHTKIKSSRSENQRSDAEQVVEKVYHRSNRRRPKASQSPALDYVRKLRKACETSAESGEKREDPVEQIGRNITTRLLAATQGSNTKQRRDSSGEPVDDGHFHKVERYSPPDLAKYTTVDMEQLLKSKVLYNDNEIVAMWKPYGIAMFPSPTSRHNHSMERYLPFLASELGYQNLHEVHRLDQTTTGVVLFATSETRRKHLKQLIASRQVVKTYYAITNGVPEAREGLINIPIGRGKIGDRYRPTLRPDYKSSKIITNKSNYKGDVRSAATEYRVRSMTGSAALVECIMTSGVQHQIRLHLGLGLSTPILGDSKYSWPDEIGPPQRVKGDILHRLKIERARARNLPIYLHARRITLPDIIPDKKLAITAAKPHFFTKTQQTLKLRDTELKY